MVRPGWPGPCGCRCGRSRGRGLYWLHGVSHGAALRRDETPLGDRLRDHAAHESTAPDGVVVARDRELHLVRVAVGVYHGDDRDAHFVGFRDGDVLFFDVDDEHRIGQACHIPDTAEVALELFKLPGQNKSFLLRHGFEIPSRTHALVLLHFLYTACDSCEVRQHPAKPTFIYIRHPAQLCCTRYRVLRLLLCAHEENAPSVGHHVPHERISQIDPMQCLVQVDDVNTVALSENKALHLRVPAPGLVPEVDSRLQKLPHRDDGHYCSSPSVVVPRALAPRSPSVRGPAATVEAPWA